MTDQPTGIAPNPVHPDLNTGLPSPAPRYDAPNTPATAPAPYAQAGQGSALSQGAKTPDYNKLFAKQTPAEPVVPEVDHLEEIAALVRSLHNISPSGAQTVGGQILEHISALQNVRDREADKTKAKV